jgi:hypothetical protein
MCGECRLYEVIRNVKRMLWSVTNVKRRGKLTDIGLNELF